MKNPSAREIMRWLAQIAPAIIITFFVITYIGQFTIVKGDSMLPTFKNNTVLFIEKLTGRFGTLKNGDIVVIKIPEYLDGKKTYAIKRIIATGGQHISIENGYVLIDGNKLNEDYTGGVEMGPVSGIHNNLTIPDGYIYVLGDNRLPGESKDSRTFGPVPVSRVEGRVIFRLYPFSELGIIN
ncbi:MAG: signal peptidase I [Clostridiaceae bacterium]|nr:signal peptidase I [Clostridiaceae bacterium]